MKNLLRLLFAAALLNAICWIIIIPVWQYPDEQAHFVQIQDTAELGRVPDTGPKTSYEVLLSEEILGTRRNGQGVNKFTYDTSYKQEYSKTQEGLNEALIKQLSKSSRTTLVANEYTLNPPLYYFLGSAFYKLVYDSNLFVRVYMVRIMSVLIFMINVAVAYEIAKLVFEGDRINSIGLAATMAFTPMLIYASTGVLPDTLINLLFSIVILISLLQIKNGLSPIYFVYFLITLFLGSLTRQQFLIAAPIYIISIFVAIIIRKQKKYIYYFLALLAVLILLSQLLIPFRYIKDLSLPEVGKVNLLKIFSKDFLIYTKITLIKTYKETLVWYWGNYRWLSLNMPIIFYQIIKIALVFSALGLALEGIRWFKNKKMNYYLVYLFIVSIVYAATIFIWDFFFQSAHGYSFGLQGRYFFPTIVAHLVIITFGIYTMASFVFKKNHIAQFFTPLAMIIFNAFSLYFIASTYYHTKNFETFIREVSQYKPFLFKGNIIMFIILIALATQIVFIVHFYKKVIVNNAKN